MQYIQLKNKWSQKKYLIFFLNPRQMDIEETSYAMQVTKTQIQINMLQINAM